ncbi:MAG: hypothetical protein A2Z04_09170 [Chloroflexi bacterium RBG_16_57_9]|nr:MAG: hypothetical protein A2Z04_09170 [Chloroflexi bacterium RBG_16_57_9]
MATKEMPILLLQDAGQIGQEWTLMKDVTTIGRDPQNDITLPDRQVSRFHTRIQRHGRQYQIEDCQSKNGTFINGEPLNASRILRDGDEIQVAMRFKLYFVDAEATAPLRFEEPPLPGIRMDPGSKRVWVKDIELTPPLSAAQYTLLELLYKNLNNVCDRESIIQAVWPGSSGGVSEQAIDALIRRLRDRIAEADPDHQYIVTVRSHGFMLENSEA